MTDQTPRTETDAWRDLMRDIYAKSGTFEHGGLTLETLIYEHRPAIEAQARAEGLDAIEERVRALPWDVAGFRNGDPLAAVLAILAGGTDEHDQES